MYLVRRFCANGRIELVRSTGIIPLGPQLNTFNVYSHKHNSGRVAFRHNLLSWRSPNNIIGAAVGNAFAAFLPFMICSVVPGLLRSLTRFCQHIINQVVGRGNGFFFFFFEWNVWDRKWKMEADFSFIPFQVTWLSSCRVGRFSLFFLCLFRNRSHPLCI